MSEGNTNNTGEMAVHSQAVTDVEALVQAAVSVLTNDMQIATHDVGSIQMTNQNDENTVQLLVDTVNSSNIQERLYMCTDCNLAFYGEQGEQEWQWHLRQHKPYKCDLCTESFEHKDNLKTHIRSHTVQMPYICEKCGSAYSLKSNLTQHMKTHEERQYQCSECNVLFKTESDLTKHMKFHTGQSVNVYQCDVCSKTFAHQKNLVQHAKIHQGQPKQYKCPECPACYSFKCHLTRHLMIHTGDKPYKCKFCGKAFNRNAHLVRHRKIHSGGEKEWKCQQCGFAFWERSDLIRHVKSHEGNRPFSCKFCDQTFVWKRYLYKHCRSNHIADDQHFCPECCECFKTAEELQEHQASTHQNKRALTHTCGVCSQEFHFKYKLDEHMYVHTGQKAHECDKCPQKFISRKELDRHKTEHAQEVSFSCNTCEKSFSSVEHLQGHLKVHTGSGKYFCTICANVSFRWKSQLANHMVMHSSDHDFLCSICNKVFKRKRDLTRHVKIYHDTKPPFTCTECQNDFHSPDALLKHKTNTHWRKADELDSLFACNRCSGMFKVESDLEKHVMKVHPPRPFLCTLCSKRFTLLKFLNKHFEGKHPDNEMTEGLNFEIKPQKEVVKKTVSLTEDTLADDESFQNGGEELEMEAETIGDEQDQSSVDDIKMEGSFTTTTLSNDIADSDNRHFNENVVVIQQDTGEQSIIPLSVTSQQQQAPMSEAITLAQFSQQASGSNTLIPVLIQGQQNRPGQQQMFIKATKDIQSQQQVQPQQHIVIQNAPNFVQEIPTSTKPHVVTIPAKGQQHVIKLDKSTAQSLLTSQVSMATQNPTLLMSPTIKVIKHVQNSGGVVHLQQQQQQKGPDLNQIKMLPLIQSGGQGQYSVVTSTEMTPVQMQYSQPIQVNAESEQMMITSLENVQAESIQSDQASGL